MRVPKYRLHKGSGQALIEWKGQRRYLGIYGTPESQRRYREFVTNLMREASAAASSSGSSPSSAAKQPAPAIHTGPLAIAHLAEQFLDWATTYYRDPETGLPTNECEMLRTALGPLFKVHQATMLAEFGPAQLKEVRDDMIARKWSRQHINGQIQRIRRVFRWGVEHGLVPPTTPEALKCVPALKRGRTTARETSPIRPADDVVVEATLPFLPAQVAAMVRLQRATGMRSQNICRMKAGEIDTSREAADKIWILRPDRHKMSYTERPLIICLGPTAQAILRPFLLARQPEDFIFSPAASMREVYARRRAARKSKVQPSQVDRSVPFARRRPGTKYTTASYRRAIRRAVDAYNATVERDEDKLEHWTPHRLRHSRGTEVRSRYGLEAAQVVLGHAKADVTQIYAERDSELAVKVARETG